MNTMNHKGYTARVEFDERDSIFVGRVLGLHTMISFHGETVAELRSEFETAIEEFLRDCKEQGVRPEKPASGKLMLRVPPEVHGAALVAAQAAGKSLNQWALRYSKRPLIFECPTRRLTHPSTRTLREEPRRRLNFTFDSTREDSRG